MLKGEAIAWGKRFRKILDANNGEYASITLDGDQEKLKQFLDMALYEMEKQ